MSKFRVTVELSKGNFGNAPFWMQEPVDQGSKQLQRPARCCPLAHFPRHLWKQIYARVMTTRRCQNRQGCHLVLRFWSSISIFEFVHALCACRILDCLKMAIHRYGSPRCVP